MNTIISARALAQTSRPDAADAYLAVMTALAGSLERLTPEQWDGDTECAGWTVRHMACHLIGAQEDMTGIPALLWRRVKGRRRYPHLSSLDAANQVQVDDHAHESTTQLGAHYRANIPAVVKRVGRFPNGPARITVERTMAPGNTPLRIGYLFNVIYVRDAWMHGLDLARATGEPRVRTVADRLVVEQIVRDAATAWGAGPGVELELTGDVAGTWRLGEGAVAGKLRADSLELCRSLSGRLPESGVTTLSGDSALGDRLARLRILF
ncbi:maleylpyruvate isomerase family mycothiol-dependent enzyme [Arthrobacter sp. LAPM80]|uniref:maleylpyruvate isomerase family mycothiol-dependent enzyme n=1 Tax=Arthrobacter sp. LAPM80 TaxID=3141788 RepID=UPI00398A6395